MAGLPRELPASPAQTHYYSGVGSGGDGIPETYFGHPAGIESDASANPIMSRLHFAMLAGVLALALAASPAGSQQAQTAPEGMPARDSHQGLVIAADPYTDAARSKEKFGKKHPQEAGILALEVAIRNNTDDAITVNLEKMRLVIEVPGERRQNLDPLTLDSAADRIAEPQGRNPTISRSPIPGRSTNGGHGKDWQKLHEVLERVALASDVLPPRSTIRGFLFFDINQHFDWLTHASLYVPELRVIRTHEELLYFEVELAPAVKQP